MLYHVYQLIPSKFSFLFDFFFGKKSLQWKTQIRTQRSLLEREREGGKGFDTFGNSLAEAEEESN